MTSSPFAPAIATAVIASILALMLWIRTRQVEPALSALLGGAFVVGLFTIPFLIFPPTPDPDPTPTPPVPSAPLDPTPLIWAGAALLGAATIALIVVALLAGARKARAARDATNATARAWTKVREDYQTAMLTVASYETDIGKAITRPAFNDPSVPETRAMIAAMRAARDVMECTNTTAKIGGSPDLLAKTQDAVRDFALKVEHAEKYASAKGMFWRTPGETSLLEEMDMLLRQARDYSNQAMRKTLYERIKKKADELERMTGAAIIPSLSYRREVETHGLPELMPA